MRDESQLDLLGCIVCPSCNGSGIERIERDEEGTHAKNKTKTIKRCGECKGSGQITNGDTVLDGGL